MDQLQPEQLGQLEHHGERVLLGDSRNQNPASYTSANFRSSAWYNQLAIYNPTIATIAGTGTNGLQNAARVANAQAAGLPANFFMVNPSIYQNATGAVMRENGGNTRYDAVQFELRRRLSQCLLVQGSYIYGQRSTWARPSLRDDFLKVPSTVGPDQAIKLNWVYQLPFGSGRRFGGGATGFVEALIGGWEFAGSARFQSGPKYDVGGYTLVGMTDKDLQDMFKFYKVPDANGKTRIYMFPQDVIQNSIIANPQWSATSLTGYSGTLPTGRYIAPADSLDCAEYLDGQCSPITRIITAPWYGKTDFAFSKRFRLGGSRTIEARMDLYNVFDNINFSPGAGSSTTNAIGGAALSSWEVTAAARDLNASQDAGGRITSFGLRFNW